MIPKLIGKPEKLSKGKYVAEGQLEKDKLAEFIERKMNDIEPGLNPKDRVRWLWGYHDALEDVLKEIKGGKE